MLPPSLSRAWEAGPDHPELTVAALHVWRASLDVTSETLAQLTRLLSPDEQERAARYRVPHARQQFIVARGVLRTLLARYLDAPPETLAFQYSPYGKPTLPAPWPSTSRTRTNWPSTSSPVAGRWGLMWNI
jgi:4'-phosphopantetheinyl transferase